jgi:hypothetical protein
MHTLRIDRKIVHADWQWLSMRKRSPEALYYCTTASKRPISPGLAPMPMCNAETEPSARAAATKPAAMQATASAPSERVDPRSVRMTSPISVEYLVV